MEQLFDIAAHNVKTWAERHHLVKAESHYAAIRDFETANPDLKVDSVNIARCYQPRRSEHQGELSVWEGMGGQTAVLCQYHGEHPV
jgi:hypothetical protein